MRPIFSLPLCAVIRLVGAGSYRMFMACRVIGAILITLGVIGLAGGMAIESHKDSINFSNYYWTGRSLDVTQSSGQKRFDYYPGPEWSPNIDSQQVLDRIWLSRTGFIQYSSNCHNPGRYEELDGFLGPPNPQK